MTDRVNMLHVALTHDIREDDVESLVSAILHLKGVLAVEKNIVSHADWVARHRIQNEVFGKILNIFNVKDFEGI